MQIVFLNSILYLKLYLFYYHYCKYLINVLSVDVKNTVILVWNICHYACVYLYKWRLLVFCFASTKLPPPPRPLFLVLAGQILRLQSSYNLYLSKPNLILILILASEKKTTTFFILSKIKGGGISVAAMHK